MSLQDARGIVEDFQADWGGMDEYFSVSATESMENDIAELMQQAQTDNDGAFAANVDQEMCQLLSLEHEMLADAANSINRVDSFDGSDGCGLYYFRA